MKFFFQNPFSIKKVLIFGGFGLCRFQHKVGMNSFPMCMNLFSYGTNSFPWGMYSFRSKIPIVFCQNFHFNYASNYHKHLPFLVSCLFSRENPLLTKYNIVKRLICLKQSKMVVLLSSKNHQTVKGQKEFEEFVFH